MSLFNEPDKPKREPVKAAPPLIDVRENPFGKFYGYLEGNCIVEDSCPWSAAAQAIRYAINVVKP